MKRVCIIRTDNFDRDYIDDYLCLSNIAEEVATLIVEHLNADVQAYDPWVYRVVDTGYKLKKFEP